MRSHKNAGRYLTANPSPLSFFHPDAPRTLKPRLLSSPADQPDLPSFGRLVSQPFRFGSPFNVVTIIVFLAHCSILPITIKPSSLVRRSSTPAAMTASNDFGLKATDLTSARMYWL